MLLSRDINPVVSAPRWFYLSR